MGNEIETDKSQSQRHGSAESAEEKAELSARTIKTRKWPGKKTEMI